jgi:hypothetical protein
MKENNIMYETQETEKKSQKLYKMQEKINYNIVF